MLDYDYVSKCDKIPELKAILNVLKVRLVLFFTT